MLRKSEFINAPDRYHYNYKIEAIEKFLDNVEKERYEWAMNFLPLTVNMVKTLDLKDYRASKVESDTRAIKKEAEILRDKIHDEQHKNFEIKFRTDYDKNANAILELEDYRYMPTIIGNKVILSHMVENDERISENAKALLEIIKQWDKDDKLIRNSFKPQLDELTRKRNEMKLRKELIKEQKQQFKELIKTHGRIILQFDLELIREDKIEEAAHEYAKIEREMLRYDIYRRTTEYVGKLKSMDEIHWGDNGSLNGIVYGEKGDKARVETIIAGGNIQCEHYRVLIKPVK